MGMNGAQHNLNIRKTKNYLTQNNIIFIMFDYVDNDDGLVCFSHTAVDP